MFVNGDALGAVFRMLGAAFVLLVLALIAHLVWIARLVRSVPTAARRPGVRAAALTCAAALPVASYYAVETCRVTTTGRLRWAVLAAMAGQFLLAGAGVLVLALLMQRSAIDWPAVPGRFPGVLAILAVPHAILLMAGRVLLRWSAPGCGVACGRRRAGRCGGRVRLAPPSANPVHGLPRPPVCALPGD